MSKPNLLLMNPVHLSFLLLFTISPITSIAEEPAELDDLIVTAGLEPISIQDVASSITIITREEIEQRQVKYLSDLLRDVPGFAVSQAGGPGSQTQIRVRGAEANQLLVLMDGVRANDPASGDEFQFQYALSSNIERIEIIRGPQSATWGTDALAGVINIVRRKDISHNHVSASSEYGSFNSINLGVDGGLSGEHYQLSGGLTYQETDGTNVSRQGNEKDGSDNSNANLALSLDASDAVQIVLSGQLVGATTEFDDFDFIVTGLPVDADRVTESERRYLGGEVRFNPAENPWSGSVALNWLDTDNENFSDGILSSSTAAESVEFRAKTSVLLGSSSPEKHRLTFAIDREEVDFSQRGIASPFGDPNQDQSFDVTGYAAEYVGKPFAGFTWTASGRLDDFSDFDSVTTWQLAASQYVTPGFRLKGSIGTGSKAPTFTDRYGFFSDVFIGNPDLKPETSKGWEFGFETDFGSDHVQFGATYFNQKLEDEIDGFVFDLDTFLFTAENKADKSSREGIELTMDTSLTQALSISAGYTYLDATEVDPAGDTVREVRRPKHMASLSANYLFADSRGNLNLNINYNGTQLDNFFSPATFATQKVEIESHTLVDLAASWQITGELQLVARVSNLFDEDYEEILGFVRPGRGVFAGIRGRFQK